MVKADETASYSAENTILNVGHRALQSAVSAPVTGNSAISKLLDICVRPTGQALAWLGQQGTRAIAVIAFIAIAIPPLGALLKPYVKESIFLLLFTAFMRVDMEQLRGHFKRPAVLLAGTAWTALAVPALFGLLCAAGNIATLSPDIFVALILQAVASPIMSSPAFAMLMGLDATLVLATLVTTAAVTPFTAALFVSIFGLELNLSPMDLGLNLFAIVTGSAALAGIVRKLAGMAAITRHSKEIDGFNIILLFIFVAAIMENVGAQFLARPLVMLGLTALAFAVFLTILFVTGIAFIWAGRTNALALSFMSSQRNMGLMLAATGGVVPDLAWLYFAIAQLPIFLSPYMFARPVKWAISHKRTDQAG
ncbi:MAG: Na+-dependent transporter [Alphaproteobacteria bacterium]